MTNSFAIERPKLWWPNGLGPQNFHEVTLDVKGRKLTKRLALRKLEVITEPDDDPTTGEEGSSFYFKVNGRPVFAKGANWIPCDAYANRQTKEKYSDLLESAAAANLNMIRVWGGGQYEKDSFYDICDELGLLVWQDFMFACGNYPDGVFLESVQAEAIHQLKRLRDHGSIALWCGDNECRATWKCLWDYVKKDPGHYYHLYRTRIDLLKGLVAKYDPARTFWPGSPCNGPDDDMRGEHLSGSGDVHYWGVWHGGQPFRAFGGVHPRFCSEFGFQSYPSKAVCRTFLGEGDLRLDSPLFDHHQKNPGGNERIRNTMKRYFRDPKDFDSLLYLSQVQQALAIRTAVEFWRAETPWCMGTIVWQLNDDWPVSSWSMLEYGGQWKHLMYHAKRFYGDIAVMALEDPWDPRQYVLSVVNGSGRDLTDTLVMERWDFDGTKPLDPTPDGHGVTRPLTVKAGAARRCGKYWGNVGFTVFRFAGAENYWVSAPYRDCPLAKAKVGARVSRARCRTGGASLPEGFEVEVSTDYPAFFVWLEAEGIKGEFSDNSFLLLPTAAKKIVFTPKEPCTLERFKAALSVRHLAESYQEGKAGSSGAEAGRKDAQALGVSL